MIYAVGETVFDIFFRSYNPAAAKPGGSAFNAIISLGRMGVPSTFISEVGNDRIGNYIRQFLAENGVFNDYVEMFDDGKTALSLAFLNENSDAEYDFYKHYPSHRLQKEIPEFSKEDYLLFGSFYGLNPLLRPQIRRLLKNAAGAGALIYYDPNFRDSHMDDLEELRDIIEENIRAADLVRASDEDLRNIYGVSGVDEAYERISPMCKYFIYTANADGVDLRAPGIALHINVERIKPVSTVGAGDSFNAGILYSLYTQGVQKDNLSELKVNEWEQILKTAAAFSKVVCLSFENYIPVGFEI